MEKCLGTELPPASSLEEALRTGVVLARLALFFAPDECGKRRIYDPDEALFRERGLVFKHTDNLNLFFRAMRAKKFPEVIEDGPAAAVPPSPPSLLSVYFAHLPILASSFFSRR
jgi:hypothetical protein